MEVQGHSMPRLADRMGIAAVALLLSAACALLIDTKRPDYLRDYTTNSNPDALHYVLLGETVWQHGHYSRQGGPPYQPDILRPPVYPLLAGGVQALMGVIWPLYFIQTLCTLGTSLLVYSLGVRLFGRRVGLAAGLLVAADGVLALLHFEAMTEPVFTLLATAAVTLWVRGLWDAQRPPPTWKHATTIGLLAGLAALTRPTGQYLPLLLALMQVAIALTRQDGRLLRQAGLLFLAGYAVIAPWILRNAAVSGVARLTIADTVGLVYNAAAGAYQVELGISRDEAQERIRDEYGLVAHDLTLNYWLVDQPIQEIDAKQRAAVPELLRKYPASLVRATLTGLVKSFLSHHTPTLASMCGEPWHTVGLDTLLRGQVGEFLQAIAQNHPALVAAFVWQMVLNLGVPVLAIAGLLAILRTGRQRAAALALVVVTGYYLATVAVIGLDAYCRHRAMVIPFACLFAAVGLHSLSSWFRSTRIRAKNEAR